MFLSEWNKWPTKTFARIFEGRPGKMKISRGKIHEYLGMALDFLEPGEVKITIIPYFE